MFGRRKASRREFMAATAGAGAALALLPATAAEKAPAGPTVQSVLPKGATPNPVPLPHFPDRLHAFIWRNWELVPLSKLALVLSTSTANVSALAQAMGLPRQGAISLGQQQRSYITVIKRNWHLLPYSQLLDLLGWTPQELAYTLREDDFLFVKLGNLKPACAALKYSPPDAAAIARVRQIAATVKQEFGRLRKSQEALFAFVDALSRDPATGAKQIRSSQPRFCYSYFALYGDPLLDDSADPYPDEYLAKLAEAGVNGVWLQGLLYKLAPFSWQPELSNRYEIRLNNLRKLAARARKRGIGIYLYLNEPRSMPLRFFENRAHLKGVTEGEHAALCTSQGEVRNYLSGAIRSICRAVPDLEAFFTITASENLTNCWSHGGGGNCSRCARRSAAEVIAEVNSTIFEGIAGSGARTRLLAWDWGWSNSWAEDAINRLPTEAALLSVSEWDLAIQRGGVTSTVGEYSISAIGPGPRARRHWEIAKKRGMKVAAKIQAGNTWELSAVPYIPAVRNVAEHALNLRSANVDGVMLGWTLGGYPSPNLDAVKAVDEVARAAPATESANGIVERALLQVASRRFGGRIAPAVVQLWNEVSAAFSEFPYNGGVVYSAPLQTGPANLLWGQPTGYQASMVGFPYDDLDHWRGPYPPETFAVQLEKVANGFDSALKRCREATGRVRSTTVDRDALQSELRVCEAAALHFRSVANQTSFVIARKTLAAAKVRQIASTELQNLQKVLESELRLARRLYTLQQQDSRIGFEASNQYYYVPGDLVEKVLNCRDLLERWLPEERKRHGL